MKSKAHAVGHACPPPALRLGGVPGLSAAAAARRRSGGRPAAEPVVGERAGGDGELVAKVASHRLLERDPDVVVPAEETVERAAIEREDARGRLDLTVAVAGSPEA